MVKEKKSQYDWKKTVKKVAFSAVWVILAGLAAVYGDNPYYLAIAPILAGIENIVKHWNG